MKCTILVFLTLAASVARAGDGAVEINQASVLASGGFPFTISQAGKYVLTGNLTVADADTSGILITARGVTLDLAGFGVLGPVTCSGDGTTRGQNTACSASGSGIGIIVGDQATAVIRNGLVRGMGNIGISVGGDLTSVIERVVVEENASHGINLYQGRVASSSVRFNGGDGIWNCDCGGSGSHLIEDNVVERNRGNGIRSGRGLVRGNYIFYNGGAGVLVPSGGANVGAVIDNRIETNSGNAINSTSGTYRGNTITGNLSTSGHQVVGTITNSGDNFCSPSC
jgi:hypothetical protein